jgi:hypothetical protein
MLSAPAESPAAVRDSQPEDSGASRYVNRNLPLLDASAQCSVRESGSSLRQLLFLVKQPGPSDT